MTGLVKKLLICGSRKMPVEEGHIWVMVGKEEDSMQRFSVEANFLNHPLFDDLLRLSEGEFGYSYGGALRIACEADLFLHLLALLRGSRSDPSDLINRYYAGRRAAASS